jgi:hypothetical protein
MMLIWAAKSLEKWGGERPTKSLSSSPSPRVGTSRSTPSCGVSGVALPGLTKEAIKAYAEANIALGARVVSDGLGCFGGLADAGLKHKAVVTGSGRPKDERLKWANIGLGNIKSAITGTCRSFDPQHTERYLASYEWRFNRRFDLDKNVERLARVAAQTAPAPYQSIAAVHS